jgi:prenyltransferase beta subunit
MNEINRTKSWLKRIRNSDNGWGDLQKNPTKIICTGEIVTGLLLSKETDISFIDDSLNFLNSTLIEDKCKKTSVLCWATIPLLLSGKPEKFIQGISKAINRLYNNKEQNGGWGYIHGTPSRIYPTILALRVLMLLKTKKIAVTLTNDDYDIDSLTNSGLKWLLSQQNDDGGWGIASKSESKVTQTAHAMILFSDFSEISAL